MIVYLDTSAFIPLLVAEPGTSDATRLWNDADEVVSSRLIIVESAAAISMAGRLKRLDEDEVESTRGQCEHLIRDIHLVDVWADVIEDAARLARDQQLRAYDALHLATALRLGGGDLVMASGDRELLRASRMQGLAVADTSGRRP